MGEAPDWAKGNGVYHFLIRAHDHVWSRRELPVRERMKSCRLLHQLALSANGAPTHGMEIAGSVVLFVPKGTFCDECGADFVHGDPSWWVDIAYGLRHRCPEHEGSGDA